MAAQARRLRLLRRGHPRGAATQASRDGAEDASGGRQFQHPFHPQFIDEDGTLQANAVMEQAAAAMLDELVRTETALRPLRPGSREAA